LKPHNKVFGKTMGPSFVMLLFLFVEDWLRGLEGGMMERTVGLRGPGGTNLVVLSAWWSPNNIDRPWVQ
jgi:hypothetical protein